MFGLGIVAHIDRLGMAEELKDQVDADLMSVDEGHLGPNLNHKLVWRTLLDGSDADWLVVLEEDALPVNDFRNQLDHILLASPAPVTSLYLGRQRPPQYQPQIGPALDRADELGASFILANQVLHAVALAIRTELVADMLANLMPYPIDQSIGRWCRSRRHPVAYSVPSIVDHSDVPTLITHPDGKDRAPGRVAWRVGTRETWTSTSVDLNKPLTCDDASRRPSSPLCNNAFHSEGGSHA